MYKLLKGILEDAIKKSLRYREIAKKLAQKEVNINTKLVEELMSKADVSELFNRLKK